MSVGIDDGLWGGTLPRELLATLMQRKIISCDGKRLDALWYGQCKRWRLRQKAICRACAARRRYQMEGEGNGRIC